MSSARPSLVLNFANTPDYLDTRIQFTRNSIASYIDRQGNISYVPAQAPRWQFDPFSGECLGILIEPRRTNSFLHSENFSNAAWTKTNCSVSANTILAPSGASTATTLITESNGGSIRQNITIVSVDQGFVFSVYAKAGSANFALLKAEDGVNSVSAWYNLTTNTAATNTSLAGGSVVLHYTQVDPMPNGWLRCTLGIRTTTAPTYTLSFGAAISSGASPAVSDSIYLWGAQAEENVPHGVSSYIPTTTTAVMRQADNTFVPVAVSTDKWFNISEGSLYFEWDNLSQPDGSSIVIGGIGDTFSNTAYATKGATQLNYTFIRNGAGGATLTRNITMLVGSRVKAMMTWSSTSLAAVLNGAAHTPSFVTERTPASVLRIGIGTAPWSTSSNNTVAFGVFRLFSYYPHQLSNNDIQTLTIP
jgi:hypothetical protein